MIGAGTVIGAILKIVTTVAVLGAAYLFIVKPVLDTTNNAFDEFGFDNFSETFDDLPTDIQDQVDEAFEGVGENDAKKLSRCIEDAVAKDPQNQRLVNRCIERFG